MYLTNYHTHTNFSDGNNTPEEMIQSAVNKNIKILGFSDHSPVPFFSDWNMKYENIFSYITEIETLKQKYSDKIEIYTGLEVDYIENITGVQNWKFLNLDYTIGSVHFLKKFETGEYFTCDFTKESFKKGLDEIFEGNIKTMISYYYEQINNMISECKPNVIGHINLITKFNKNNYFFDDNDIWYKNLVKQTLEIVKQNNCIIEINTRGFYKKLTNEFYPSDWILKECKNQKIPMMINSDAHHINEIDTLKLANENL